VNQRNANNRDWFEQSFDDHYARIYKYKDETALAEVGQMLHYLRIRRRRVGPPQRILDLACGWGRHSVPLALRGFQVTGVDFSEVMLRLAEQRAAEQGLVIHLLDPDDPVDGVPTVLRSDNDRRDRQPLTLLQADMRSLPFVEDFDVVIDVFTSFGYFRDPSDNAAVLDAVYQALAPGGKFLLDIDNPQFFVDERIGKNIVKLADDGLEERVLREERYVRDRDRRVVEYSFIDQPSDSREDIYLECKLYDRDELVQLLVDHGFGVDKKVWGDFSGTPFGPSTPRLITVATKPRK
jgi:SAM-dependent methyltransferase